MIETRRLNYEDFLFEKLTYNEKSGVLKVFYKERGGKRDGHEHTSVETPHPDLLNALQELNPHFARVFGLVTGWEFALEETRKDLDRMTVARQGFKESNDSVKVISVARYGDGETEGVKMSAFLKCLNGETKVNCPVIRFGSEAMGIEQTVQKLFENVKQEAFGFIFQNKRKQYTIEEQEALENKKNKKSKKNKNQLDIEVEAENVESN